MLMERETQDRECIYCHRTFRSRGPQNRICSRCRTKRAGRKTGEIPTHGPGPRRGRTYGADGPVPPGQENVERAFEEGG